MRVIKCLNRALKLTDLLEWGFDDSSAYQSIGNDSDFILKPAYFTMNPSLADR